jgi:hypothetical protein
VGSDSDTKSLHTLHTDGSFETRLYIHDQEPEHAKKGVKTVAAAFTDHLTVLLRLSLDVPLTWWGRG